MKSSNKSCFLFTLLVGLLGALSALAQVDYSTATLRGTITDPQGAVIPAATVTATSSATGISKSVKGDSSGHYQLLALPPGTYQLSFEAPGFGKSVMKGVQVTVGQTLVFDTTLKVGTVSETVEVDTDNVPLIQVDQSQQANTINSRILGSPGT